MVNALRTLLLNQAGFFPSWPGEEYVPPDFVAQPLPASLARVWRWLFGVGSDRALLNWRLRDYLNLLHSSELAAYVTALDPRITYLPWRSDLFDLSTTGPRVTAVRNPDSQQLQFTGPVLVQEAAGSIRFSWLLEVVDATTVSITQNFGPGQVTTTAYTMGSSWSSPVALPGSTLQVQFSSGTGAVWQIDALATPQLGLPQIALALASNLSDDDWNNLFGPPGSLEPWATFRNLWFQHDQLPYRLGGVVLALGYQLAGQNPGG